MCRTSIVQIQPRKHVDYTALTGEHELDHTEQTDRTDNEDLQIGNVHYSQMARIRTTSSLKYLSR